MNADAKQRKPRGVAAPKARPRGPGRDMPPLLTGCESLMSREDIAQALRISIRKLNEMVATGEYPQPDTMITNRPRWRREHHDAWVRRACKVQDEEGG